MLTLTVNRLLINYSVNTFMQLSILEIINLGPTKAAKCLKCYTVIYKEDPSDLSRCPNCKAFFLYKIDYERVKIKKRKKRQVKAA